MEPVVGKSLFIGSVFNEGLCLCSTHGVPMESVLQESAPFSTVWLPKPQDISDVADSSTI